MCLKPNNFQLILPHSRKHKRNLGSPLSQESPTKYHAETSQIKTENQYEALANVQETNPNAFSTQITHIPPFILYRVTKDVLNLIKLIGNASDKFTCKLLSGKRRKFKPNSIENYKKIKEWLDMHNIVRHAYKLPEDKLYNVVLRNLYHSTDHNNIKNSDEKGIK